MDNKIKKLYDSLNRIKKVIRDVRFTEGSYESTYDDFRLDMVLMTNECCEIINDVKNCGNPIKDEVLFNALNFINSNISVIDCMYADNIMKSGFERHALQLGMINMTYIIDMCMDKLDCIFSGKCQELISLCCIAKMENRYIREFVEHYKKIGFSNITIYDNNDIDGERVEDVISDYVESGFVDIIPAYGLETFQMPSYMYFYNNKYKKYKWIAYFDCDEYLELRNGLTLSDFLSMKEFDTTDIIHVNWLVHDDNDNIIYEDKPLRERFPRLSEKAFRKNKLGYIENEHVKSIVRTTIHPYMIRFNTPHTVTGPFSVTDSLGNKLINESFMQIGDDRGDRQNAYIHHYRDKTISEFLDNKINKGWSDTRRNMSVDDYADMFFGTNTETEPKKYLVEKFQKRFEK